MAASNGSSGNGTGDAGATSRRSWSGAGFAGLYMLSRLRRAGVSTLVLEAGDDVGGTWYWNRYPGARCDIPTTDYTYSWDPELETEWTWSEKYATQPEILRYLQHVADKHDLRRDIRFGDPGQGRGVGRRHARRGPITTGAGDTIRCRWYVMATGCLSVPEGARHRGRRPLRRRRLLHEPLAARGRRPHRQARRRHRHRLVGHPVDPDHRPSRRPRWSCSSARRTSRSRPATAPPSQERLAELAADRDAYRDAASWSRGGVPDAAVTLRPRRWSRDEAERLAPPRGGLRLRRAVRRSSASSPTR